MRAPERLTPAVRQDRAAVRGAADGPVQVAIYKPFFLAGIVSVLTTGCMLGAIAMLGISLKGDFINPSWSPYILAHANSQLYGWVGLFVMGFALQQHPPRPSRVKLYYRLAYASLALIVVSIALRFLAEPLVGKDPGTWMPVGIASGVMQAVAVLLFIANTGMTRHRATDPVTGKRSAMPWQSWFVFASLGWWLVAAASEPFVFAATHRPDQFAVIQFIAEWSVPYREAQFLGFVINMIFGVALARLSSDFGVEEADRATGLVGFGLWNVGLLLRMFGWLSYFRGGMDGASGFLYFASAVPMASGVLWLVIASRLFERVTLKPGGRPLPSVKFFRAAFGWLLIAGALMVLEPIHLRQIGAPFSHAYTGAIRHALTVGFISQMILGVSMFIVPKLRGLDPARRSRLWSVFWLLNVGNALRVAGEIATDYTPRVFLPMGATGFIELTGLLIWAVYVGAALLRPVVPAPAPTIRRPADVSSPAIS